MKLSKLVLWVAAWLSIFDSLTRIISLGQFATHLQSKYFFYISEKMVYDGIKKRRETLDKLLNKGEYNA